MQTKLFPHRSYNQRNTQEVCAQAIRLLVLAGEQAPVELFLQGLKNADVSIRIASISALVRLQARSTRASLRPLLQDEKRGVREAAAWTLACWGEASIPHELLQSLPPAALRGGIAAALPPNWSRLFPLPSVLFCTASYHGLWGLEGSGGYESENDAFFRRLAEGISPEPLLALLWHARGYEETDYVAWRLLKAMEKPLPLDLLSMLLSLGVLDPIARETALLLGERRIVLARDLLAEMWAFTAGRIHAAITVALDDLGMMDGIKTLCTELQGKDEEAKAAIWGLGMLGLRGRPIPQERLHQMVHHSSPRVRAEAILALSSLNDISVTEALTGINDDELEPFAASFQAFRVLVQAQYRVPVDVLTTHLIDLVEQKYPHYGYSHASYYTQFAIKNGIRLFDELYVDIPLKTLLDAFNAWEGMEPLVISYWRRHTPDIFAEMMVQAKAFLQQYL